MKLDAASATVSLNNRVSLSEYDVAVIGAGPYGLSAGAHLKAEGIRCRVFGEPMQFWAKAMPEGMLLRSPRVASNLSDPHNIFTLDAYEAASNIQASAPVPLDTFVEYGRWFRQQLESELDERNVMRVEPDSGGFQITLIDGTLTRARRVVVATGIGPFKKRPAVFQNLPHERVIHSYDGRAIRKFAGKRLAVIGGGQSALESAALLHEAGADVEVIARQEHINWIGQHSWLHRMGLISAMLYSPHDVGPIGISRLVAYPNITKLVPLKLRDRIRTRAVRPAGARWLPERLKNVRITTAREVEEARIVGGDLVLKLSDASERFVDHVLLGTGYKVDISKYDFLPGELKDKVEQFDGYPKLGRGFSCSVPGLHFIGATAARAFGPLLYFVAGTEFASRELTAYIAKRAA